MRNARSVLLAFAAVLVSAAPASAQRTDFVEHFDGKIEEGWSWLDEDLASFTFDQGRLNVVRYPGKGFYGTNMRIPVLHRKNVPFRKGLVAQVKVGFDVDEPYGQVGLVLFYDNDRYAKYILEYWYNLGLHVIFLREDNGVPCHCKGTCEKDVFVGTTAVELRIRYDGRRFHTEFRREGEPRWTRHFSVDALPNQGPINVGLFSQADSGSKRWAWFDDFELHVPAATR